MTLREKLAVAKRNDSLGDVAETMMERNIRHMPVMNGDSCEGMLSIKDVVREVLEEAKHENEGLSSAVTVLLLSSAVTVLVLSSLYGLYSSRSRFM